MAVHVRYWPKPDISVPEIDVPFAARNGCESLLSPRGICGGVGKFGCRQILQFPSLFIRADLEVSENINVNENSMKLALLHSRRTRRFE